MEQKTKKISEVEYIGDVWEGFQIVSQEQALDIQLHPDKYENISGQLIDISTTDEYIQLQTTKREAAFKKEFFEIQGFGWFRKKPKGYSSALESLMSFYMLFSNVGAPRDVLTFYKAPDFCLEEQCNDEWIKNNSFKNTEMSADEVKSCFQNFLLAWNEQEHKI